ncbi:MAG TPA: hypothetical protein VKO16_13740, partial [Polyangia bacterium]|nr:hypothetical protein [Polyangia bacterium]
MRSVALVALGFASVTLVGQTGSAHEAQLWTNAPRRKAAGSGLSELAERARAAVVHVRGEVPAGTTAAESDGDAGKTSIGTGFIINREGYVVTNEHVV